MSAFGYGPGMRSVCGALALLVVSPVFAGDPLTEVREVGLSLRLPGKWVAAPSGESIIYRSLDGQEQITLMSMTSKVEMSLAERKKTLTTLVKHHQEAERQSGSPKYHIGSPAWEERRDLSTVRYVATDPEAHLRFMTLIIASPRRVGVFFYESRADERTFHKRADLVRQGAGFEPKP